jgi:hypothetical protein
LFCFVLHPPLTVQFTIPGKQRKIAKYYKKQENLLKDFSEMETMNEMGGLDQNAPTEVQAPTTDLPLCTVYAIMEHAPKPSMSFPL